MPRQAVSARRQGCNPPPSRRCILGGARRIRGILGVLRGGAKSLAFPARTCHTGKCSTQRVGRQPECPASERVLQAAPRKPWD